MPVPVFKSPVHPTRKHFKTPDSALYHERSLSLPAGAPPLGGALWPGSLPSWKGSRQKSCSTTPVVAREQDFWQGLASAVGAPAIKGVHAEACIPPFSVLTRSCDMEEASVASSLAFSQGFAHGELGASATRGWSSTPNLRVEDEAGVVAPLLEDDSSELINGDLGSSPIEPLTPFGDYVDRAVATSGAPVVYDLFAPTESQELHIAYPGACGPQFEHLHCANATVKEVCHLESQAPPTASLTYKRLAEPMAECVVSYVWKVCINGILLPQSVSCYRPLNAVQLQLPLPLHLTSAVHSLLMSTLLQPSAILLALWYIARLPVYFGPAGLGPEHVKELRFRAELLNDARGSVDGESLEDAAAFRLVVLGFMLANKWLDDHTFSNKTWHTISNVPVKTLNKLEYLALDILSHDLSISPSAWGEWLKHLLSHHHSLTASVYPQPISRPSSTPHSVVRRTIQDIMDAPLRCLATGPVFLGVERRFQEKYGTVTGPSDESFDINLDEDGPLREEYLPRRRSSDDGSARRVSPVICTSQPAHHVPGSQPGVSLLPPPRWSPGCDEYFRPLGGRVGAVYMPILPRYVAPLPAMYQAWPPPYFPPKPHSDGELGSHPLSSQNPCWCPLPQNRASQLLHFCYCTDLYRASNREGHSYRGHDGHHNDIHLTSQSTGLPVYTTTSWIPLEPYGYLPSRQSCVNVNYQSHWLRA